ncbi:hypothetical protein [Pedobacter zeae]|uniref:Outer membrane protein beta-barrel domain-containing protein n=1 Tax=Pedobacter zeae TaxID=1737356 RepID=A0A7W6KE96_9SPHI|nr:hypothetical protein [Pedobacter zeae]MBB4109115.1 hypothetical protein [Pedobacter zeae]GGH10370.1 hypothetical protein GCM10007422_28970 [Pedobacter zeae]
MKEGKDIDKLFKDGLENPDLPFNDLDWDNLEERLHPAPKRRGIPLFWYAAAAGIAAMLLIVFLLIKPNGKIETIARSKTGNRNQNNIEKSGDNAVKPNEVPEKQVDRGVNVAQNPLSINRRSTEEGHKQDNKDIFAPNVENGQKTKEILENNGNMLAGIRFKPELSPTINEVEFMEQPLSTKVETGKPDRMKPLAVKQKSRFVLSILAAPDLTSVQKSGQSSLSGGFGVEATYAVTKRISITTGAVYAKKIYDSDFSLYKPNTTYVFSVTPSNIHANCDVIDIPLNVNYKIFNGRRNSISVSTGLSSYLMLKEQYTYSYDGAAYKGPKDYTVRNQNQHYLGIANVGLEFQHKINNNLSISAKPFMKIPLTDIGYGNSRLSSTGVAISVNMNLFKKN